MNNQAKKIIQIEALDNDLAAAKVQNLNLEEMTLIKGGTKIAYDPKYDKFREIFGHPPITNTPISIKDLPFGGGLSTNSPSDSKPLPIFNGWISL